MGADLAQQVLGVTGLADDLEAVVLEHPHHSLAEQDGIIGNHYAHGISTSTTVPSPTGL